MTSLAMVDADNDIDVYGDGIAATPLSTPATSPCGNKYQTYSTIFFANFREEQLKQRLLQQQQQEQQRHDDEKEDKQPQKQLQFKFRSTVRPCRETAINNINNNNLTHKVEDTPAIGLEEKSRRYQPQDFANGNGIENFTYPDAHTNGRDLTSTAMGIAHGNGLDNVLPAGVELQHTFNGTLYTSMQTSKIRITENPLPEPVSC